MYMFQHCFGPMVGKQKYCIIILLKKVGFRFNKYSAGFIQCHGIAIKCVALMSWDCLDTLLEPASSLVENKDALLSECGPCVGASEDCCVGRVMCMFVSVFSYYRVVIFCLLKHRGGEKTNHSFNRVNWKQPKQRYLKFLMWRTIKTTNRICRRYDYASTQNVRFPCLFSPPLRIIVISPYRIEVHPWNIFWTFNSISFL